MKMEETEISEEKETPETPETTPELPVISKDLEKWVPKTSLGKAVMNGEINSIEEILLSGKKIREPEIVDKLLPNLKSELILIGGRTGKGGGRERIPIRTTATMTKSGRRFTMKAFVVVGNEDGIVGIGKGSSPEGRKVVNKAIRNAKLNLIFVNRGCGSWECSCGEKHSIPFKTIGKCGSVRVELIPAPKGVGLVCNDEIKKIFRLAGIKDIWTKSFGNTATNINFVSAIFDALKNLNIYKR
jgi:small subunit ribosomal protein S5